MVYALAAFVVLAFLAGTMFRAPMLAVLAVVSLLGSIVALLASGTGVLATIGWAVLITLLVEAAFVAGMAAIFMLDEGLIRSGRTPLRRRHSGPLESGGVPIRRQ